MQVAFIFGKYGGRTWARTKDPLIKSQLLYQLSYASTPASDCLEEPVSVGVGGQLAASAGFANPKLHCSAKSCSDVTLPQRWGAYQVQFLWPLLRLLLRSIAMMMPTHNMTVSIDDPP